MGGGVREVLGRGGGGSQIIQTVKLHLNYRREFCRVTQLGGEGGKADKNSPFFCVLPNNIYLRPNWLVIKGFFAGINTWFKQSFLFILQDTPSQFHAIPKPSLRMRILLKLRIIILRNIIIHNTHKHINK